MDGNSEQVRLIAEQLMDVFESRQTGPKSPVSQDYVDTRLAATEHRVKFWVISGLLGQLLAIVPVIFLLGGIYSTNNAALLLQKEQQKELVKMGQWMEQRERWELSVELWGADELPRPFLPPRYKREGER